MQHYDYIITGAGCAGLSLLRRLMQNPFSRNKKILLIDNAEKNQNNKTWCFWEKQKGLFDDIVFHTWQQIDFYSNDFAARYDLLPYQYKMIRGIDLCTKVLDEAKQFDNIELINDEVVSIHNSEGEAYVKTTQKVFYASYVFNSIVSGDWRNLAAQQKNVHILLQHFKGWMIETSEKKFDVRIATFMDFRVDQNNETAFFYMLPVANSRALVEYTLFSENIAGQQDYDSALKNYISDTLQIKDYAVLHTEQGVIPMTNYGFSKGEGNIINIGTAGGQTKGSTGYTFQFIQKHSAKIIDALVRHKNPLHLQSFTEKRFHFYDGVLLHVLCNKRMRGDKLFAQLFRKNKIQNILKFLDNETGFAEELKIMNSVSLPVFLPAALKESLQFLKQ